MINEPHSKSICYCTACYEKKVKTTVETAFL
jgi:hypothetical protein